MPRLVKQWPYAETSAGRYRGRLEGRLECWEANGPARDIFNGELDTKIKDYIVTNLPESDSFIEFSLFMVGRTQLRTSPTVLLVSNDKPRRKAAFEAIKTSGILEQYPGFQIAHCRLAAEFEDLQPMAGRKLMTRQQRHSPITDCGIYISISDKSDDPILVHDHASGILNRAQATIGRLILRDGHAYGVTVAHVLADHATSLKPQQFSQTSTSSLSDSPDFEIAATDDLDPNTYSSLPTSPPSSPPSDYLSPATQSGGLALINNTERSAQCDSPDHCKGATAVMHVSSDLDIMLLAIDVNFDKPFQASMMSLLQFSECANTPIHDDMDVVVKSLHRAPITGRLSATSFHAQYGGFGFQRLYLAKLSTPLRLGDCGSWVFTRSGVSDKIVGIIVAGSPSTGTVLILPGQTVLNYVKKHATTHKD
ncbi:hypothetical protein F5Y10DRAFT_107492 [Nemania abortiva]|nr:hypothetical protein F5Y10DRAFT_107492 [Nemania abortiva]